MKKAIRILLAILLICLAALTVVACKPDDPVIDPQEQCKQNGHSWEMSAKYPTCDAEGKITYTCTVCGATDERVLPPTGNHSWDAGKETTPPTCGVEGVRTYTCTECGETRTEAIPATGEHKLGEHFVEVASTCEREGSREYWLCQDCGNKVDQDGNAVSDDALVIPKLSHVYEVTDVTEPTCEETGKITYTCTVCGKASFDKEIPATGHSYGRLVDGTEATCTTPGMQAYYHCDRCGKYFDADKRQTEYDDLVIDKLQHRWVEVEGKQATCTEEGLTDGVVCEQCGVWQQPQTSIPAKGHNEQPIPAVAATCTEGGLTEGVRCADCGKILVYPKHTAALGHSYVVDVSVGDEGWIWGDDFLSATLNFVCANVGCPQPHVSVDAEVEVSSDDPDHTAYKATARYQGNTYTKEHSVNHNHTEHTYTVVEWRWDGYTSASVVLRCTVGNEQQTVAAEVTKEETRRPTCAVEGLNTYTATAQGPDGKTYTDVKQETVAVTSHNYVITHEGDAFGQHHEQCSVCGDDKQPVSCTIVENHCTVCDYTYTDDEILTALFALAQKTELPGTYKLSGTVTKMVSIRNTSKNQDVIFNMQVGGRIIYVYHAVGEGFDKVAVGSQVTIVGSMDYKNEDQHRFYDCTLTIDHSPTLTIDSSITNGKFNDLPDSVVGRTTVQFSITPDDGYYVESVKVNGETLDPVDGIYTIDVYQDTVIEVTIVEGTQQSVDYVKLTSQDLLQEGLQFIIVASDYDFAMKPYESGNNLKGISITKKGNVITVVGDVVQVVVLEQGYLPNTWALKVGNKYLCATGIVTSVNKNQLKTVGDKNADGASWKITIDSDGIATIVAQPNSGNTDAKHNVLRFNSTSGNELFNCYSPENADDQQAVSLYYKAGGTVVDPGKEMVTLTVNHDGDHGTAVGEDGKALAGSYEKGTVLKFRITPNTGWEVDAVTVKGAAEPLTLGQDGYYTVTLDEDTEITVTYKSTGGDTPTPPTTVTLEVNNGEHGIVTDENGYDLVIEDSYNEGTTLKFRVSANAGWTAAVTANSTTLSPDADGLYTAQLDTDTTITVTYSGKAQEPTDPTTGHGELVTDVNDLQDGDRIVIVSEYTKDGNTTYYALGNKQSKNNNNRPGVEVTLNTDGSVTLNQEVQIIIVHKVGELYTFELLSYTDSSGKLQTGGGYYLYAASNSKNYLRTDNVANPKTNIKNNNYNFSIDIDTDGTAAIQAKKATNTHNILSFTCSVNNGALNPLFACYDKKQTAVKIYKFVEGGGTVDPGKEMVTLTVNHDGNHGKAVDEDGRALSGEYEKGTELKFRINANEGWVVDKVTVNESPVDPDESGLYTVMLNAATTILVTYKSTGGDTPTPQEDEWKLVTDVSELQDGDQIIIVGQKDDGTTYALSNIQQPNNRRGVEIELNADGTATLGENVQVITVHIVDGKYTFEVVNYYSLSKNSAPLENIITTPGYLNAAGNKGTKSGKTSYDNYLHTQTTLTNDGKWTIEISSESYEAKIQAQGTYNCNILRFNPNTANNIVFACYHEEKYEDQKAVKIYKLVSEEEPAHEHVWTVGDNAVTWTADVNGATATLTFTCTAEGCTEEGGAITVDVPKDKINTNTVAATCQNKGSVSYSVTLTEEDIKGLLTDKGGTVEVTAPVTSTSETFYTNTVGHEVDTEAGLQSDAKGHYYKCKYGCDERLAATDHVAAEGWKYDETTGQHYHECTYASQGCTEHLDKTGHEADKTAGWQSDAQGHYYKCKYDGCNARVDEAVHQFGAVYTPVNENGKDTHTRQCSECNYVETNDCSPAQGLVSLGADTHAKKCELCNDTISSTVEPHDFSEGACECGQEQSLVTLSWGDSNTHNVNTLADAIQYIKDGGTTGQVTITVHDDRELPGFTVETSWNIVLDLQGHTYTATSPITVAPEATFSVENGTITNSTNFGAAATVAVRRSARTIASDGNVLVNNQGSLNVNSDAHIIFKGGNAEDIAVKNEAQGTVTIDGEVKSEGTATAVKNEAEGNVTLQGAGKVSSVSGTALKNEAQGNVTFSGNEAKATTENGVALDNSGTLGTTGDNGKVSVEVTGTGEDSSHAVGFKNSADVKNVQVDVTVPEDSKATGVELNSGTFAPSSESNIDGSVVVDPDEGGNGVTATLPDNFNGNVEMKGESTGDVSVTLPDTYDGEVTFDENSNLSCDQIKDGDGTLAHDYTDQTWKPDPDNPGQHYQECTRCHAHKEEECNQKNWNSDDTQHWKVCSVCGYEYVNDKTNHTWNTEWSKWTDKDTISVTFTCSVDGCGKTLTYSSTDGDSKVTITPTDKQNATCTEAGYQNYQATVTGPDGNTYTNSAEYNEVISATGHTFEEPEPAKDATCTTPGNNAYKYCDRCGKYYAADANKDAPLSEGNDSNESFIIGASGHNFETTVEAKPASCTAPGNDAYKHCINCDKYYAETATTNTPEAEGYEESHFARPQLNHEYNEYPTKRDDKLAFGTHQPVCSLCHTAKGDVDDCEIGTTTPNKCDVCGYTYTAKEILTALEEVKASTNNGTNQLPGIYKLSGVVTEVDGTNIYFDVTDGEFKRNVEAFELNDGDEYLVSDILVGSTITVEGSLHHYGSTYPVLEFNGGKLVELVQPIVQVTVTYEQSQGSVEISPALESGKVEAGTTITITVTPSEDYRVSSVTANDEKLQVAGEENKYTYRVVKDTIIKVEFVDKYAPYEDVIARFKFGQDDPTKKDTETSSELSTKETFDDTLGSDLKLSFESLSKVYTNSYDINGVYCLKLGTSSVAGTFEFTVPDNITKVVIYVAGRNSDDAKIKINNDENLVYTITSHSKEGEFTPIVVDTTTNKTVSLTTMSGGWRCKISQIEFYGMVTPPCPHKELAEIKAQDSTCQEQGWDTYWQCNNCKKIFGNSDHTEELKEVPYRALANHQPGETPVFKQSNATCTTDGYSQDIYQCEVCKKYSLDSSGAKEYFDEDTLKELYWTEKLGHNFDKKYIYADEHPGQHILACDRYDECKQTQGNWIDHDKKDDGKNWYDTNESTHTMYCPSCGWKGESESHDEQLPCKCGYGEINFKVGDLQAETGYNSLEQAIANLGEQTTIYLVKDITDTSVFAEAITQSFTLDLQNYTLTLSNALTIGSGAIVTIQGTGTLNGDLEVAGTFANTNLTISCNKVEGSIIQSDGQLTLNKGTTISNESSEKPTIKLTAGSLEVDESVTVKNSADNGIAIAMSGGKLTLKSAIIEGKLQLTAIKGNNIIVNIDADSDLSEINLVDSGNSKENTAVGEFYIYFTKKQFDEEKKTPNYNITLNDNGNGIHCEDLTYVNFDGGKDPISHTYLEGICSICGAEEAKTAQWELVTSVNQLQNGDRLIFAYAPSGGKLHFMTEYADSKFKSIETTIASGTTEIASHPDSVTILTLGITGSQYTLQFTDANYLAYNSGTNFKKAENTTDDSAKWTISDSNKYFCNVSTNNRGLLFQIGNVLKFGAYATSNLSDKTYAIPVIYRLPTGSAIPEPAHICQHVCPEPDCGKCTDSSCHNPVCEDKCPGHGSTGGGEEPSGAYYEKITSTSQIISGGKYLIVCESKNKIFDGSATAKDQSISITISNNQITNDSNVENSYFIITAVTGGYEIQSQSGNYISRNSASSGIDWGTRGTVTITFSNGNALIKGTGGCTLQLNASYSYFRFYSGTQTPIQLYILK